MKLKKLILLTAAAVAALAALALPAAASAAEWKMGGKALTEHAQLNMSGGEVIEVNGGVMLCESNLSITTEGGSEGLATYEVKPGTCVGLAGNLEGCTVSKAEMSGTPWTVDVKTTDAVLTGFKMNYTFAKGCAVGTIAVSIPELTLTPYEEPSSIRGFEWSTEGPGTVDGKAAEIGYFGSSQLPEEEFGTYEIG